MTTTWFTSDLHIGHRLVADHRGFDTVEVHDDTIAERWEAFVKPEDTVWVLGDIAVSRPADALMFVAELPGTKHLISGNHDGCHPMHRDSHKWMPKYLEVFATVQSAARRRIDGTEVLLSHFPYDRDRGETRYPQWRLPNLGTWLLHGHTHGTEKMTVTPVVAPPFDGPPAREIHVGLDAWEFAPVNINTIRDMIRQEAE